MPNDPYLSFPREKANTVKTSDCNLFNCALQCPAEKRSPEKMTSQLAK